MFNTQTVLTSNYITNIFNDEEMEPTSSIESSSTIADYIEAVSNNFYNKVDPVLFVPTAE